MPFDTVNAYLWYGYLPKTVDADAFFDIASAVPGSDSDYSVSGCSKKFNDLMDKVTSNFISRSAIIPLSGGYDSRAILGAMLERLDSNQISTMTFGAPGQLDFDLGKLIARKMGVKHHAINLRATVLSWDSILESVRQSPWTYVPDGYFNRHCIDSIAGPGDTVWLGYLGDPLAGSHLSETPHIQEACLQNFIKKQRRIKDIDLCAPEFDPQKVIVSHSHLKDLSYDDFYDISIRQASCIAPIFFSPQNRGLWGTDAGITAQGARIAVPFGDPSWAHYWLTAPREVRKNQHLYLSMLESNYPRLFALPSKARMGFAQGLEHLGHIRSRVHSKIEGIYRRAPWLGIKSDLKRNYIDYNQMFRQRVDYRQTLEDAIHYAHTHRLADWLDIENLYTDHSVGRRNHGELFTVFIGLAANHAAHGIPPAARLEEASP